MPRKIDGSPVIEDAVSLSGSAPAAAAERPNFAPRDIPERFAASAVGAAAPGVGLSLQLVLLGSPTSSKAVQAQRLAEEYHVPHISVGQLLRDEVASGSQLGRQLESAVTSGQDAAGELVDRVIEKRFANPDVKRGFVLDGYDKDLATIPGIEAFQQSHGLNNLKVVELEDSAQPCQSLPVIDYFKNRGDYYTVDGSGSVEDVADNLSAMVVNFASNPLVDYHLTR